MCHHRTNLGVVTCRPFARRPQFSFLLFCTFLLKCFFKLCLLSVFLSNNILSPSSPPTQKFLLCPIRLYFFPIVFFSSFFSLMDNSPRMAVAQPRPAYSPLFMSAPMPAAAYSHSDAIDGPDPHHQNSMQQQQQSQSVGRSFQTHFADCQYPHHSHFYIFPFVAAFFTFLCCVCAIANPFDGGIRNINFVVHGMAGHHVTGSHHTEEMVPGRALKFRHASTHTTHTN